MEPTILHIDMNAFFATCETILKPYLRGKPIGVCGNPQGGRAQRSVIASCSYEARKFGVENGMPPFKARELCPQIILVEAHREVYEDIGKKVFNILKSYSNKIEQFSVDEWYVDLTQTKNIFERLNSVNDGSIWVAKRIKQRIKKEIHPFLNCSIGISFNKILAKLASRLEKPDGLFVIINERNEINEIDERGVKIMRLEEIFNKIELDDFAGIGDKTKTKLEKLGVKNIKELRNINEQILKNAFGTKGFNLKGIAEGKESMWYSFMISRQIQKGISRSETLARDLIYKREIYPVLLRLTEEMSFELRQKNLEGNIVKIILRYQNFETFSKQKKLDYFTFDTYEIFSEARKILDNINLKMPVRLVGIGLNSLRKTVITPCLFGLNKKRLNYLKAQDKINSEYGLLKAFRLGMKKATDRTVA